MPILLTFLAIVSLLMLVAYLKLDTFISFIIVSIMLGIATGMDVTAIGKTIQTGIGSTLGDLILIIGFGAMFGNIIAESGAAQRITDAILRLFGTKYLHWGLALAGFIIGIPLFYNAGFIIVMPLIFVIASATKLPLVYVGIPMLSALSVAHGYLPPHPSPTAITLQLHADMAKTLIYGLIVAIPAIIVAGPIFGSTLKKYHSPINKNLFNAKEISSENQPSLFLSLLVALMPVFLLTFIALFKSFLPNNILLQLIGEPYAGMLISLLIAIHFLGVRQGKSIKELSKSCESAFKNTSTILLIIAGAGALKQILKDSGTSDYIAQQLQGLNLNPLILGWIMAGVLRICVGSATIAGLTTVGILAPLIQQQTTIKPELMVLSIGAGSLMFSHLNDSGFWLFKEYFNLSIKDTLKTWTVMETLISIVGLLVILALNQIL